MGLESGVVDNERDITVVVAEIEGADVLREVGHVLDLPGGEETPRAPHAAARSARQAPGVVPVVRVQQGVAAVAHSVQKCFKKILEGDLKK